MFKSIRQRITAVWYELRHIADWRTRSERRCGKPELCAARWQAKRGFALLLVMVALLVMSLMLVATLEVTRQGLDEAAGRTTRLKLAAAMDGALLTAAYDLSRTGQNLEFAKPIVILVGGTSVTVVIRPELSKLDINYASADSLRKLLEASGVKSDQATHLAANIIAWRNNGSFADVEQGAAQSAAPKRPFETLADLSLVRGGGPDLVACLGPDITVFTRTPGLDTSYASARQRHAVYGNTEQPGRPSSYYSVVGGEAARPDLYEIRLSAADAERSMVIQRQTVVRVTAGGARPMLIVGQTAAGGDQAGASAACSRLASHGQ